MQKKIMAAFLALTMTAGGQFLPPGGSFSWGMHRAEAGWGGLLGDIVKIFVPTTWEQFMAEHQAMMYDLAMAAVYTNIAEIKAGQALGLEPEKLQGVVVALQALGNSPTDMNAIRTSSKARIPEKELQARAQRLMSVEDKARLAQFTGIMQESATYRSAARSHSGKAAGHAAKIIAGAAAGISEDKSVGNIVEKVAMLALMAQEAQEIQKIQKEHSDSLKLITKDIENRVKIKEPKGKEAEKMAQQMLNKQ